MNASNHVKQVACGTALVCTTIGLSGCGIDSNSKVIGTWDCRGNVYVFSDKTWSAPGTPSENLPYKVEKEYIYLTTLARENLPLLKIKDGIIYNNMEGTGFADTACTKK